MKYNDELLIKARKIAILKIVFYIHLIIFISVNLILFFIWYYTYELYRIPWFLVPLIGWGSGLIGHGFNTYKREPYLDKKTEKEYFNLMDNKY
jgi:hypothetical protein